MDWNNEYNWDLDIVRDLINHYFEHSSLLINLNDDGLDVTESGLEDILEMLDVITDGCPVSIYNANLLKSDTAYNDIYMYNPSFLKRCQLQIEVKKNITRTFCMFSGRPSWDRLALGSWLFNNANGNCTQSFHGCTGLYPNFENTARVSIGVEFDTLCKHAIQEVNISDVLKFIDSLPIQIGHLASGRFTSNNPLLLEEVYKDSFVEIVAETAKVGTVFFPTEKTFRPILFRTPFIIFGPVNFLKNLKKLGFKTFDKWFNETYDTITDDNQRLVEVQNTMAEVNKWSFNEVQLVYTEMLDTMQHNYDTMMLLTSADFNRDRFNE